MTIGMRLRGRFSAPDTDDPATAPESEPGVFAERTLSADQIARVQSIADAARQIGRHSIADAPRSTPRPSPTDQPQEQTMTTATVLRPQPKLPEKFNTINSPNVLAAAASTTMLTMLYQMAKRGIIKREEIGQFVFPPLGAFNHHGNQGQAVMGMMRNWVGDILHQLELDDWEAERAAAEKAAVVQTRLNAERQTAA